MKKAHSAPRQENHDTDDTDLGLEEREIDERETTSRKSCQKSFQIKKKAPCCSEDDNEDSPECEIDPCEMEISPLKPSKPKKISQQEKMGAKKILAHSYVLNQEYEKAFTPDEALRKGTLFPELWGVYPTK
jgi:hypothetical protein